MPRPFGIGFDGFCPIQHLARFFPIGWEKVGKGVRNLLGRNEKENREKVIAVGTAVADGPPHRSVREALPHTAPPLSGDGHDVAIATSRECSPKFSIADSSTVSGATLDRALLLFGDSLSSTNSAADVSALFARFAGTIEPSDFLLAFMSVLPSETFSVRSAVS